METSWCNKEHTREGGVACKTCTAFIFYTPYNGDVRKEYLCTILRIKDVTMVKVFTILG